MSLNTKNYPPILIVYFVTVLFMLQWGENRSLCQDAQPKANIVKVKAIRVGMLSGKGIISGMGSISCPKTVELGFDDNGVISEILVEEGDPVKEGQVLAKLDSSVLEAERLATEAKLASAEAELKYNQNELDKKESLFSKNAVSDTDFKKAALEVDKSKASIEYSRAEIRMAEAKLKRRILYAPMSGLVSQKHVEAGSVISPSSNKVVSMISCREAYAEIELGEKLFSQVRPGMSVRVKADALEGQAFEGRIIRTAPQIDKKHRTFIVKAKIDNSKWVLRPGMFVRAEIDSSDEQIPLWLPRSAVQGLHSAGPVFVFVVKDGMALKRNVLVGKTSADKIEIVKGLAKGDLAIIQGLDRIADLDEVSVEISENQVELQ